jgi:hypothetical protein
MPSVYLSRASFASRNLTPSDTLRHMDTSEKHNRAITLLQDKGHSVGLAGSNCAIVDNQRYSLSGLISLVEEKYPGEWRASERDYDQKRKR